MLVPMAAPRPPASSTKERHLRRRALAAAAFIALGGCSSVASCATSLSRSGATGAPLERHPATPDDLKRIAEAVVDAVYTHDRDGFNSLVDCERLGERVFSGMRMDARKRDFAAGLCEGLTEDSLLDPWHDTVASGGRFVYRGVADREGFPVARFRFINTDGGFSFVDALVEASPEGRARISDLHTLSSGEYLSVSVRRFYLLGDGTRPGLRERMRGKDDVVAEYAPEIKRFRAMIESGRHEEALALFKRWPRPLQQDKSLLLLHSHAASEVDDDLYLDSLERLLQAYPDDPCALVASLDVHLLREEPEKGLRVVDAIEREYPDPYWEVQRAHFLRLASNEEAAEEHLVRALEHEPDLYEAHALRVHLAADRDDWDEVDDQLRDLAERFERAGNDPQFGSYRESEEEG
jgi:hypothetical protein